MRNKIITVDILPDLFPHRITLLVNARDDCQNVHED